jgi:hypothetical protein
MWVLSLLPFFFQAIAIAVDEGYFHYKRGLPLWERIGHPIDTFSVLLCMAFVIFIPFSFKMLCLYIALAAISCLLVTKDEFVHKDHCPAAENWLHALLFTLHPITLTCAGFIWPITQGVEVSPWIARWLANRDFLQLFLYTQFTMMFIFMTYQIVFWNFLWKNKPVLKQFD